MPAKPPRPAARALAPRSLRDTLDRDLLALLQANARESTANLARKLGVARTTVVARLNRLDREGVVVGYSVRLRQDVTDQGLQAFVGITVEPRAGRDVLRHLTRMPEVRQLNSVSGEFDYVALLAAESAVRLDSLLDEIGNVQGVVKTTTSVVLSRKIDRT